MALINCPECDTKVSNSARKCPTCGVQINKPKRSMMGKIFKWSFILFNIFMILGIVSGISSTTEYMEGMSSDAEKMGAEIGTTIGIGLLLILWVLGDIILGLLVLLTRPK